MTLALSAPPRLRPILAGVSAIVLVGAAFPAFASQACGQAAGPVDPVDVPALTVAVSADNGVYRHGQIAVVPVVVSLGTPKGSKVAAAQVKIQISSGSVVVKELFAQTNSAGMARPRWTIGARVPNGTVTAIATASVLVVNSYDCSGGLVNATGRGTANPLTTIRP